MKQKPTVGRIVHYYTANKSEQSNNRGVGPYAAIIVGLCGNSDDPNQMVNVNVFADHGADFCAGSVLGLNTEDADPSAITEGRYWVWPPRIASVTSTSSAGELTLTSSVGVDAAGNTFSSQEPKYEFLAGRVRNRASGEVVPLDEPVFLLRAKDNHALETLGFYQHLVSDDGHKAAVQFRIDQFAKFAASNAASMKEPDTDKDAFDKWADGLEDKPAETFFDRLKAERDELKGRMDKLAATLSGEQPVIVTDKQWNLMKCQRRAMIEYHNVLVERIEDLSLTEALAKAE